VLRQRRQRGFCLDPLFRVRGNVDYLLEPLLRARNVARVAGWSGSVFMENRMIPPMPDPSTLANPCTSSKPSRRTIKSHRPVCRPTKEKRSSSFVSVSTRRCHREFSPITMAPGMGLSSILRTTPEMNPAVWVSAVSRNAYRTGRATMASRTSRMENPNVTSFRFFL